MGRPLLVLTLATMLVAAEPSFIAGVSQAPMVLAAQARLAAAQHQAGASGRLADPMLGAGYTTKRAGEDRWPVYEVSLEQPLPRWGERVARGAMASATIQRRQAEVRDAAGEVAAEVATLLAEAQAAAAKHRLVEARFARATALVGLVTARMASGMIGSAEGLALHSRLAALAVERDTAAREQVDAEQEARARLGLTPEQPLPPFTVPGAAAVVLERVPGLEAAQAMTAEAEARFTEARSARYPETSVGLRLEQEQQPGEPMTAVGLEVRVSLPVWTGAVSATEASARAEQRAGRAEAEVWRFRARAWLARAERAATVAATARAAAEAAGTRLEAESQGLLTAAAAGDGPGLMAVLEVLDRQAEAALQVIEAEAAARLAAATLWRLAPPDLQPALERPLP